MDRRLQAIGVIVLAMAYSAIMLASMLHWNLAVFSSSLVNLLAYGSCALGIHLLWQTGSYRISPMRKYQSIAIGIYILSALFQLMHWPYAHELMAVAILGVMVNYSIHFVLKPSKGTRDILRLLVVLISATMFALMRFHYVDGYQAYWTASGIIALAALEYLLNPHDSFPDENTPKPVDEEPLESDELKDNHPELFN
jgi:hypothetical protein